MRLLRAQLHTGESGEGGGEGGGGGRGRGGGRARTATSSIPWLATTPESDEAVAAPPFLGLPGPQLDLPEDPQPVHFFEQLMDDDILQLIVTETNRCRNSFRDLGRGREERNKSNYMHAGMCTCKTHTYSTCTRR